MKYKKSYSHICKNNVNIKIEIVNKFIYNMHVNHHRKMSRFKVQIADKLSNEVSIWQRNDSHSVRILRQKLHLKHYEKNLRFKKL